MKNDKVKLKNWGNRIELIGSLRKNQEFKVFDGENRTFVVFLIDGKDQAGDVKIVIKGREANVQILGIIVGFANQKINLYSLQDHIKMESVSDLLIKSVLFDEAKLFYKGLIKIEKDAQKSNAYQKNQNLLMSTTAWADSRPYLEIFANDVRCTHGATIGKIDEEQLYYLKTRGLNKKEATKLIISGFFADVIQRIPDESLKEKLEESIYLKINGLLSKGD